MRLVIALVGFLCVACVKVASAADLTAIADAHVQTDTPTTNYGNSGILAVASNRTALVRFNPTTISQTPGVNATLNLKVALAKNSLNGVTVHLVLGAWNETTVTSKTLPALSAPIATRVIALADVGKVVSIDISSALSGWRANPATNFGVAIVPSTPTPNLQFGSREGGGAPTLSITGNTPNQVTVAPSGGNYNNPVAAADNAFNGDNWCVSTPCTMTIAAGTYVLPKTLLLNSGLRVIGAGIDKTVLLGSPLTDQAVVTDATLISDLTIFHTRPAPLTAVRIGAGADTVSNPALERVSIVASSDSGALGLEVYRPAKLTDVKVIARGHSGGATGVVYTYAPLVFTGCDILATGSFTSNIGIQHGNSGLPAVLNMTNSTVNASGSGNVFAIDLGVDGAANISASTVEAHGTEESSGIQWDGQPGREVIVTNSTFKATSGPGRQGMGIRNTAANSRVTVEDSRFNVTDSAILGLGQTGSLQVTVKRSQFLGGGGVAFGAGQGGIVDIANSSILAGYAWVIMDHGTVHVTDSVLNGVAEVTANVQATCARVYDRNAQFRPTGCPIQ